MIQLSLPLHPRPCYKKHPFLGLISLPATHIVPNQTAIRLLPATYLLLVTYSLCLGHSARSSLYSPTVLTKSLLQSDFLLMLLTDSASLDATWSTELYYISLQVILKFLDLIRSGQFDLVHCSICTLIKG